MLLLYISKCKLFSRLDALNNMVTKVWTNWNSLRSQSILVWKFYRMLYFHLVYYSKRKFVLPHIFLLQILPKNVTKKPAFPYDKNLNFWQASDRVNTVDTSFFRSSRSQMLYKIDALKYFSETHKKISVAESLF